MTIGNASITSVDGHEKRVLSQPSSPQRVGASRIGDKQLRVSNNPFMTSLRSTTDTHASVDSASMEALPAVDSFPINLSESASRVSGSAGLFVSGGNLASTGLALGIHDGRKHTSASVVPSPVAPPLLPSKGDVLSIAAIEIMMNCMLTQHQNHADER